ncbi:hypothetical protein EST38_g8709 [Candolleomyces aberdarensis]|uniref:Protein kinase domain-containing protein n=1 Tax=Candolleomyces aberdarensis TaxID=2316362 RepID=A0A4Q2DE38_9AGAR|nr:hypothetical protein EST38_g8709 [Candolleomyces aberdarensis]
MAGSSTVVVFDEVAAGRLYNDYATPFRLVQPLIFPFTKSSPFHKSTSYCTVTEGIIEENGLSRPVVLKTFRGKDDTPRSKIAQRTYRETYAWVQLARSSIQCENINSFHGVLFIDSNIVKGVIDRTIPSIVIDYVKHHALEYTMSRGFTARLEIVRQLANGVSHMHSLDLVHGDLKPDNFRVTEEGVVKIFDLAPELITKDFGAVYMSVTKQTDVYALSMTALQVLDGRGEKSEPFNHLKHGWDVKMALEGSRWPELHRYRGVPPRAWDILSSCWADHSLRPSIDALLKELTAY